MPADPRRTVVFVDWEVDIGTAARLAAALHDAAETHASEIVVDLGQTEFMDASGLRVLTTERAALERDGRRLVVRRARRNVRRLCEVAGRQDLLA